MKPYGNTRKQNRSCRYGCCSFGTFKAGHNGVTTVNKAFARRSRKVARRDDKRLTKEIE